MSTKPDSIRCLLKKVVYEGMAYDVYHAANTRHVIETLGTYSGSINKSGLGKGFFANLQRVLKAHLCLSLTRLYADCSSRNPNRSIATAVYLIESRAGELRIANREPLIQFLVDEGEARDALAALQDKVLSLRLAQHLRHLIPKADSQSERSLDQALKRFKTIRDKAVAHRDRVAPALFKFPVWSNVIELIEFAQQVTDLIIKVYALGEDPGFESANRKPMVSLRELLDKAGLTPGFILEQNTT